MAETTTKKTKSGFTADERAAMKERAKELKAKTTAADDAAAQKERIDSMEPGDREITARLDELIRAAAPELAPKLWYGMPSYTRDGKSMVFIQERAKFKARYVTLGFQDTAHLDDGAMWATSFAVVELTAAVEKQVTELVRRAVGD